MELNYLTKHLRSVLGRTAVANPTKAKTIVFCRFQLGSMSWLMSAKLIVPFLHLRLCHLRFQGLRLSQVLFVPPSLQYDNWRKFSCGYPELQIMCLFHICGLGGYIGTGYNVVGNFYHLIIIFFFSHHLLLLNNQSIYHPPSFFFFLLLPSCFLIFLMYCATYSIISSSVLFLSPLFIYIFIYPFNHLNLSRSSIYITCIINMLNTDAEYVLQPIGVTQQNMLLWQSLLPQAKR